MRTNRITNPSFEVDTTDWIGTRAALTRVANATAPSGGYVANLVNDGTNNTHYLNSNNTNRFAAAPGQTVTGSGYARLVAGAGIAYRARIFWYDAASAVVGGGAINGPSVNLPADGSWVRLSVTATAPAGTVTCGVVISTQSEINTDTWQADALLAEFSDALGNYFDGSTPDTPTIDNAWTGTAHASSSTQTDYGVTVTAIAKIPLRLTLQIANPSGSIIGSIVRADANGTRSVRVETGQLPSAAALLTVADYEYTLLYRATITYTVYSTTNVALGTLTIGPGHPLFNLERGLLHIAIPQRPASVATLNPGIGAKGAVLTRWNDARQGLSTEHTVVGRPDPIVVLRPAAYRTGNLVLDLPNLNAAQAAERALSDGRVYFLRQSDQRNLALYFTTRALSLSPLEEVWADTIAEHGGPVDQDERRWELGVDFTEVAWPAGTVTPVSVWTYSDVLAPANGYGDYNALAASFSSYANLLDRTPVV